MNIVHVIIIELIILTGVLFLVGYLLFIIMVYLANKIKKGIGHMSYNVSVLIDNVNMVHTTSLGEFRIRKNLNQPNTCDVVGLCKGRILSSNSFITREGKNWYVEDEEIIFTINASNYCIITAHSKKV